MSREKFFLLATLTSFVWYWFPGYIFTALSIFNWVCWIAPNNVIVNQLFGYQSGLGMGFITFDWAMISFVGSPLVIPVRILLLSIKNHALTNFNTVVGSSKHNCIVCDHLLVHRAHSLL